MDRKPAAAIFLLIPLCAAILFSSCRVLPISPVEATRSVLRARIGRTGFDGPVYCRDVRLCGSDVLPAFYRARDFRPAWIDEALALTEARSFLAALDLVSEDGLDPKNCHLDAIESLLSEIQAALGKRHRKARPEALVDLEMLLTDAFLLCGSQLVHGQVDPETFQSEWFIKGRIEDLAAALEKGLADKDIPGALDLLRPNHAVYRGLMKAFRTTRIAAAVNNFEKFLELWKSADPGLPEVEDAKGRLKALQ
ncbi:MAG: hypothetical protein JXE07_09240 [Candidatus Aminicenantes bacterium]|nr:hypothetical protein [Candidatus Aminicenantes bacterium]